MAAHDVLPPRRGSSRSGGGGGRERLVAVSGGDATRRGSVPDVARRLDWPEPWTIQSLDNPFLARWHGDLDGQCAEAGEIERYYARAQRALKYREFQLVFLLSDDEAFAPSL